MRKGPRVHRPGVTSAQAWGFGKYYALPVFDILPSTKVAILALLLAVHLY